MNVDQTSKNKNGIKILTFACVVCYFRKSNMYRFRLISNSELHLACDCSIYISEIVEINGDIDF